MWISLYVIYSHGFTQMNLLCIAVFECSFFSPFLEVMLNKLKMNSVEQLRTMSILIILASFTFISESIRPLGDGKYHTCEEEEVACSAGGGHFFFCALTGEVDEVLDLICCRPTLTRALDEVLEGLIS